MSSTFPKRETHPLLSWRSATAERRRSAQTLVFFTLALTAIILLCGFAIDSGLLYLAKARISRAVDGAVLAAVGNFEISDVAATNRADVAQIIRNFAAANYTDLATISTTATEVQVNSTTYTYNFYDPTPPAQDANGAYRRFVKVQLITGAGGQITSAQATARCPVHTYFIGIFSHFTDLKVSSGAIATRSPRLIMVVADRSGSMLIPPSSGNPGCVGLAPAIVTFLNFFDTSSDYIGLVSFGSNARLEMPLTTNFLDAATNDLYEAYDITTNSESYQGQTTWYIPGPDPEATYPNNTSYYTTGVRRFRFGGQTAADEGIRLALEQMMANSGWADPNVTKYMVIFTDGAWNTTRTLLAAPGYTNIITGPPSNAPYVLGTNFSFYGTNQIYFYMQAPEMSTYASYWNQLGTNAYNSSDHSTDIPQSIATNSVDKALEENSVQATATNGAPQTYVGDTLIGNLLGNGNVYTTNVNVWLQPGAVDYVYRSGNHGTPASTYVSQENNPKYTVNINLGTGDSNVLVVPGYIIDGIVYDGLDLAYPSTASVSTETDFRSDNYVTPWMWQDADTVSGDGTGGTDGSNTGVFQPVANYENGSGPRQRMLMFRNYMNLLTGYYIFKPDDPLGTGVEPLTGAYRPLNFTGGPYYPSAPFYWPFDLVGLDQYPTFALITPTSADPSPNGKARAIAYSINMLTNAAAPEWSGELFYEGSNAALSGTTSASSLMTSKAQWQSGIPSWVTGAFDHSGITETDTAHNTTNISTAVVWRPTTFNGSNMMVSGGLSGVSPSDTANYTGGYVEDSSGNYYRNTMSWSGRPTHYFDFSRSTWVPIGTNHVHNIQFLTLGNWKASEYCWHARAAGVTIYTVGYGGAVSDAEQAYLATLANATNTTAGGGTNFLPANYNTAQPIGQQFYATNETQIGVDFSNVATAINAALTQ
jgi:Flp pilus assembly protein TadG